MTETNDISEKDLFQIAQK